MRSLYSGNAHGILKDVGVVACVNVNPDLWTLDLAAEISYENKLIKERNNPSNTQALWSEMGKEEALDY